MVVIGRDSRFGPKGKQIVRRLRCGAGSPHDRSIILANDFQPGSDIVSVPNGWRNAQRRANEGAAHRSEEHTSELQSLMRISYAVFCLKKKKKDKICIPRKRQDKQNNRLVD